MNKADVTMLLRRLHTNYALQRPADSDTIDEWQRQLNGFEPVDVFAALDRIVQSEAKAPSCARVIAEIRQRVPATHTVRPTGDPNCPMCDGTGFVVVHDPDEPTSRRMGPCNNCRPDHAWHRSRNRHPATPKDEVHFGIMDGAEERKAAWKRGPDAYADVMRRQFPKTPKTPPDGAA